MMSRTFHGFRRLTDALLLIILIGLPFVRLNGESALRFDVPTLRLLFFGTEIWMQDFFIVLVAVIFLTFLILFVTTILGRVWCGWLCPQTVLMDVTTFMETFQKGGYPARIAAVFAGLAASAALSASFIGYFVSPYDLPLILRTGGPSATIVVGSWAVIAVVLYLDLIALRRGFCATACPYAKMQGVLFDDRTLLVAFDSARTEECRECLACVKACPLGIDIREGTQMACIHCAECVDACTAQMAGRGRKSLIDYTFGLPGKKGTGVRINPLLTGGLTAGAFVFLLYLALTRMPFDMNIRLDYSGGPSVQTDGSVKNRYMLSLRNLAAGDLDLDVYVSASTGSVIVTPNTVKLKQGTDITTVPVSVALRPSLSTGQRSVTIIFTLQEKRRDKRIVKSVFFLLPKEK